LTLFLEGFYLGAGLMHSATDITFNPIWGSTITDTIQVEFHDPTNYSNIIYTANTVYLNTNGTATVRIPGLFSGSYYVSIKHRNHLNLVSTAAISFTNSPVTYDFSDNPNKAYGQNLKAVSTGVYADYCGDLTQAGSIYEYPNSPVQDGMIDLDDVYYVFQSYLQGDLGYKKADLNGDGMVDVNDVYFAYDNYLLGIYVMTP
jgi:hypothetical protein